MTTPWEVVVVSSDLESRRNLSAILIRQGIDPICISTLRECREVLSQKNVGIVFCASHVSDGTYMEFLDAYGSREERPRVVVTTRHSNGDGCKDAIRCGAFDVIGMPCRPTDVEWMIIRAKRDDRKRPENSAVAHVGPSAVAKAAAARVS